MVHIGFNFCLQQEFLLYTSKCTLYTYSTYKLIDIYTSDNQNKLKCIKLKLQQTSLSSSSISTKWLKFHYKLKFTKCSQ